MKPRSRRLELVIALVVLGLPTLYSAAYVRARVTHRLVWTGTSVSHANPGHGFGYSSDELFFMPLALAEGLVRNAWAWPD